MTRSIGVLWLKFRKLLRRLTLTSTSWSWSSVLGREVGKTTRHTVSMYFRECAPWADLGRKVGQQTNLSADSHSRMSSRYGHQSQLRFGCLYSVLARIIALTGEWLKSCVYFF
jgi:hypothetical protein